MFFSQRKIRSTLSVLLAILLFVSTPPVVHAAAQSNFAGTVTSVAPCFNINNGFLVSIKEGTASVLAVYQKGVSQGFPQNAVPQKGQEIYGFSTKGATCLSVTLAISDQLIVSYASTTATAAVSGTTQAPTQNPGTSQGNSLQNLGSSLMSQLQSLFPSLFPKPPTGTTDGSAGTQQSSGTQQSEAPDQCQPLARYVGTDFGGTVASTPLPCFNIPGSYWITVAGQSPGPYMYVPLATLTCSAGPPAIPSQCITGKWIIGACQLHPTSSPVPMPLMTVVGTSGGPCVDAAPPKQAPKSSTPNSCVSGQYDLTNSAGKAQGEAAVRKQLTDCSGGGIAFNHGAASCGLGQNGVSAACTDLSGLQCGTTSNLCNLFKQCGAFTISGGSELGHSSQHTSGNGVDLTGGGSLNSCIESSFTQIQCPRSVIGNFPASNKCWLDSSTGSIYWAEPSAGNQPAHWHVCFNGYCKI